MDRIIFGVGLDWIGLGLYLSRCIAWMVRVFFGAAFGIYIWLALLTYPALRGASNIFDRELHCWV